MKTLEKRMIFAVFSTILLVFLVVFGLIKISLQFYFQQQASAMVELIKENDGNIPDTKEYSKKSDNINKSFLKNFFYDLELDDEAPYRTRYFLIHLTKDGKISEKDFEHIAKVNQESAEKITKIVLNSSSTSGYINDYYYSYVDDFSNSQESIGNEETEAIGNEETREDDSSESQAIIFLDCRKEQVFQKTVLTFVGLILIILCVIVTLLFAMISGKIMKPFEENSRRQKQFITDASHELKTPLSIIAANADVLRYKDGENVWLENITSQTMQMNKLIGDLLALTKAHELSEEFVKEEINVIPLIDKIWDNFKERAEAKKVCMQKEMTESVVLHGNKEMLERLFSILIENAVKYVNENGRIELTIKPSKKNVNINIYNSAEIDQEFNSSQLFQRFYRLDQSRNSSTGGHGIGLSIAKQIVDNHKGKIQADQEKEGISFKVLLPR